MPDQQTFESRLADAFARYVEPAPIAVSAVAVAASLAPLSGRQFLGRQPRLLVGAFLLIVGLLLAAIVGSGGHLLDRIVSVGPSPSASTPASPVAVLPSAEPTIATDAPPWEAIYLRQDPVDKATIDVVAVRPDGTERLVRSLASTVAGAKADLTPGGAMVSTTGWLHLYEVGFEGSGTGESAILDLAHPTAPVDLLTWNAPLGPRWSTTGLLAVPGYGPGFHSSYESWSKVTILDPRTGRTTPLGSIGLFGGGPSIVWARDGSGILDRGQLKPVNGGPNTPVGRDTTFTDRRVGVGGRTVDICRPTDEGSECPTADGVTVRLHQPGGVIEHWYTSTDPNEHATDVVFAEDDRSLLVMLEQVDGEVHRATVVLVTAPEQFAEMIMYNLPVGAFQPGFTSLSPDDQAVGLSYWQGSPDNPTLADGPTFHTDGTTPIARPAGTFAGYMPGSLVESLPVFGRSSSPDPSSR